MDIAFGIGARVVLARRGKPGLKLGVGVGIGEPCQEAVGLELEIEIDPLTQCRADILKKRAPLDRAIDELDVVVEGRVKISEGGRQGCAGKRMSPCAQSGLDGMRHDLL